MFLTDGSIFERNVRRVLKSSIWMSLGTSTLLFPFLPKISGRIAGWYYTFWVEQFFGCRKSMPVVVCCNRRTTNRTKSIIWQRKVSNGKMGLMKEFASRALRIAILWQKSFSGTRKRIGIALCGRSSFWWLDSQEDKAVSQRGTLLLFFLRILLPVFALSRSIIVASISYSLASIKQTKSFFFML